MLRRFLNFETLFVKKMRRNVLGEMFFERFEIKKTYLYVESLFELWAQKAFHPESLFGEHIQVDETREHKNPGTKNRKIVSNGYNSRSIEPILMKIYM